MVPRQQVAQFHRIHIGAEHLHCLDGEVAIHQVGTHLRRNTLRHAVKHGSYFFSRCGMQIKVGV